MAANDESLKRLAMAAKTRRSPLYVWMLENFDAFSAIVADAVRPNWKELAKAFDEQGIHDADHKPASDEVTRQTWWRVRKTVEARAVARSKRAPTTRQTSLGRPAQAQPETPRQTRLNVAEAAPPTDAKPTPSDDGVAAEMQSKGRSFPKPL